jgi:drug/metabolite transporter (DMT)-like permease
MTGTTHTETASRTASRPDGLTLAAFLGSAILAGGNAVAVKLGFGELAPFWSGAWRFLPAAAILFAAMAIARLGFPRGRALAGAALYGFLNFGLTYLCGYWALREVSAGASMIVLSIVPLITLFLAAAQRVERFRVQGLVGALLAAAGIVFIFWTGVAPASLGAWIAAFGGGVFMAQAPIVVKQFPEVNPVVENAIGMAIGGLILLAVSFAFGEAHVLPTQTTTLLALAYLIVGGSIGVFVLYLFVVNRWTASGASYTLLIAPLVTLVLGAILLNEQITWTIVVGAIIVLAGVYVGAFLGRNRAAA